MSSARSRVAANRSATRRSTVPGPLLIVITLRPDALAVNQGPAQLLPLSQDSWLCFHRCSCDVLLLFVIADFDQRVPVAACAAFLHKLDAHAVVDAAVHRHQPVAQGFGADLA